MKIHPYYTIVCLISLLAASVLHAQEATAEAVPMEEVEVLQTPAPETLPAPAVPPEPEPAAEPDVTGTTEPAPVALEPGESDFFSTYVKGKLEVGARAIVSRSFDNTSQGDDTPTRDDNFFGTIDRFDPDDGFAASIYLQYAICEYFGVGLTFDSFDATTQDAPYTSLNTDGDVTLDSTLLYVFLQYPTEYNLIPYLEVGYGSHDIGFDPEPGWASRGNSVEMEDDSGVYYALGLKYLITENFACDLFLRNMSISGKGEYRNADGRDPIPFEMNFDHTAWGLGVSYIF